MWILLLLACTGKLREDSAVADSDSDAQPDTGEGILVLCGGGTEGDDGDTASWSWSSYQGVLARGDVTGDGLVTVAVLSDEAQTEWIPDYFVQLGADTAFNLVVRSTAAADDPALEATFAPVDAVFIKGGDQGAYYDKLNGRLLETLVREVYTTRHGGIGGTSAGAMSISEHALAGSADYVSADVLVDSHTEYLDDVSDGGTGIHDDFLGFLPGALVDTHFSTRGRLGRLAGAMARIMDERAPDGLLGIGLDEQTCITVADGRAVVSGVGSVVLLRPGTEPPLREPGAPLVWADLALDRLTTGWAWDLATGAVDVANAPPGAEPVAWDGAEGTPSEAPWEIRGDDVADEERFEVVVERWPDAYIVRPGTGTPIVEDAFGICDAQDADMRGVNDEVLFRTLYDLPGKSGFLVGDGAVLRSGSSPGRVALEGAWPGPMATMVIDASGATWRSLSPSVSQEDAGDGALHPAGLLAMKLHILYTDGSDGREWDLYDRAARAP